MAAKTKRGATRGSVNANRLIERLLRLSAGCTRTSGSGLDVREKAPESYVLELPLALDSSEATELEDENAWCCGCPPFLFVLEAAPEMPPW